MFWFGRPSYLRWIAAGVLVAGAALVEFWPATEVPYPFAAAAMEAGDPLEVEWRSLPAGTYVPPVLAGRVAAHALAEGEPIGPSDVQSPTVVPDGWWALALEVPAHLPPGTRTRLVLTGEDGEPVPGVVVSSAPPDRFAVSGPTALIAVPAEQVTEVAAAAADRRVVVLIAPPDGE